MKLSHDEVKHIALLARMGITDDEVQKFTGQLSSILENFEILQDVDTGDIPPTAQPNELHNVLREDQSKPSLSQEEALANAPQQEDNLIKVRAVLE